MSQVRFVGAQLGGLARVFGEQRFAVEERLVDCLERGRPSPYGFLLPSWICAVAACRCRVRRSPDRLTVYSRIHRGLRRGVYGREYVTGNGIKRTPGCPEQKGQRALAKAIGPIPADPIRFHVPTVATVAMPQTRNR